MNLQPLMVVHIKNKGSLLQVIIRNLVRSVT